MNYIDTKVHLFWHNNYVGTEGTFILGADLKNIEKESKH